jgi:hypothetical protein
MTVNLAGQKNTKKTSTSNGSRKATQHSVSKGQGGLAQSNSLKNILVQKVNVNSA